METLSLTTPADVQRRLADALRQRRESRQLSRVALARQSTVPVSTIKRFEATGQISLRQFILLWQCVDDLSALSELAKERPALPRSIDEVLAQ